MSNNAYDDFKKGIKNDVKETGAGLLMVGGAILLLIVLLGGLMFAVKDSNADSSTRFTVGIGTSIIILLVIFNRTARTRLLQFWIVGLIAIPLLFLAFLVLFMFYTAFTQSFK